MAIVQHQHTADQTIDVGADGGRMTVLLLSDEFTVHLGVNEAAKLRDDIGEALNVLTGLLTFKARDGHEDSDGKS